MIKGKHLETILIVLLVLLLISSSLYGNKKAVYLKGLANFIENMRQEWSVPGCAVAVVKDGKIVFAKGFGYRDVEKKLPVTEHTLFPICSCTKAFTATLLGILVDEGKLVWNKPVREYLPGFQLQDEAVTRLITTIDLLTHRTGLPRHDLLYYGSGLSREEIYHRLRFLEPSASFREKYQYNNLMYMTAGYMAGKIVGTSWEKLVKEKLIDPLEMKTTNCSLEVLKKSDNFSLPYESRGKGDDKKIIEVPFRDLENNGPAGSINSCVTEMANWLIMNLNKGKFGEKRIISEANLEIVHTPKIVLGYPLSAIDLYMYNSYALGWNTFSYRGQPVLSHDGSIDGFFCYMAFLPRDNAGVVILTNRYDNGGTLCSGISRTVYDRVTGKSLLPWAKRIKDRVEANRKRQEGHSKKTKLERVEGTSLSHKITCYTGEFEHPGYGLLTIKLDETGEKLQGKLNEINFKLEHFHYDIFDLILLIRDGIRFKAFFHTDEKGKIGSVSIPLQTGVKEILFTRVERKKVEPR